MKYYFIVCQQPFEEISKFSPKKGNELKCTVSIAIMTQFAFQLPDAKETAIIDAWAYQEGYQTAVPDGNGGMIANPETKTQFAKRTVKRKMQEAYIRYQSEQARLAAITIADGEV